MTTIRCTIFQKNSIFQLKFIVTVLNWTQFTENPKRNNVTHKVTRNSLAMALLHEKISTMLEQWTASVDILHEQYCGRNGLQLVFTAAIFKDTFSMMYRETTTVISSNAMFLAVVIVTRVVRIHWDEIISRAGLTRMGCEGIFYNTELRRHHRWQQEKERVEGYGYGINLSSQGTNPLPASSLDMTWT